MLLEEDRIEDTGESEESFRKNTLPSVVENEEEEHLCSEKEKH